ncbi:MAG: hypothetical protein ACTIMA_12155 [Brachybacterium tyrofermentans]|uniref:hypothetical protein n=1 Tax=Brachybacterium tyrofermentans TaxID=47848 RepID=UPI000A1A73BB|nr:hypothetical protein [Brachybacterium tyrofermentans]SLN03660.1 Uncharacterized 19.3 kDa protein in dapB 3'region (ORF Z) [Corynebacterium xerosis]
MRQKIVVVALLLITAAYCWGLGWIAWGFVRAGSALGYGLALGIVILLGLTVWVTWREVLFGIGAGDLARRYEPPADADAEDPRAEFEAARAAVQDRGEQDWTAWFRLALAYDALRDRKGARMATRRAIDARRADVRRTGVGRAGVRGADARRDGAGR